MTSVIAIIPTYNRAALIGETISAVLGQSRPPDDILVVDDGSSDNTQSVLAGFEGEVRILSKPNGGKPEALNVALATVTQEWVWIVDDDDLPEPDALESLLDIAKAHPEAGLVYGRQERFSGDPETGAQQRILGGHWRSVAPEEFLVATLEDFFAHQPGMIVKKAAYDRAGLFDRALKASEDYDMLIRLAETSHCVGTDALIFRQRIHDGARGAGDSRYGVQDRERKWKEWDAAFFKDVRRRLDLETYLPGVSATDIENQPELRRRALFQRGVVMLRRSMWDDAFEDLRLASQLAPALALNEEDSAILRRGFGSKYGVEDLLDDEDLIRRFRAFRSANACSRRIVSELARGLRWRIREALISRRRWLAVRIAALELRLRRPF